MWIIEDEAHAELQDCRFQTREDAIAELARRANVAWDEEPNRAPCTSWRTCGRRYELIEYDDTLPSWQERSRELALEISAKGVQWHISSV